LDLIDFREKVGREKRERTEGLVDEIVRLALEGTAPEIENVVLHRFPDDDCWLCYYTACRNVPKIANAKLHFVNAGERLPGHENDPATLHFDTGGGSTDQHGKGFRRTCSAALLARELGVSKDPGLKLLIELVTAVDNIEPLSLGSIHFIIEGYPRKFKNPDGTIDWQTVQQRVFELFDIVYEQETGRAKARENFPKYAEWTTLPNGIKIVSILWHPECREVAFKAGAYVVVWTVSRGKNHFYAGIQSNRKYPLYLDNVAAALRDQEAKVRNVDVRGKDLHYQGKQEPITSWFLHDSNKFVACGTRGWKPTEEEYTRLAPRQIVGLCHRALSAIPREIVSQWNKK
jgi:hypothetical protein